MRGRSIDSRSREIIDIISDVVKATSVGCYIRPFDEYGPSKEKKECPKINFVFGTALYVKERLDELSATEIGTEKKFPLIALWTPVVEDRTNPKLYCEVSLRLTIACSTFKEWSNEQRRHTSFHNVLQPIYRSFFNALKTDGRFELEYDGGIPHQYIENYSYGRYGAVAPSGEEVSEPIDAINITDLKLKVKPSNCKLR